MAAEQATRERRGRGRPGHWRWHPGGKAPQATQGGAQFRPTMVDRLSTGTPPSLTAASTRRKLGLGVGDTTIECPQAGRVFQVAQIVRPTPNPNFRRVEAAVSAGGVPMLSLSTIVGRH